MDDLLHGPNILNQASEHFRVLVYSRLRRRAESSAWRIRSSPHFSAVNSRTFGARATEETPSCPTQESPSDPISFGAKKSTSSSARRSRKKEVFTSDPPSTKRWISPSFASRRNRRFESSTIRAGFFPDRFGRRAVSRGLSLLAVWAPIKTASTWSRK